MNRLGRQAIFIALPASAVIYSGMWMVGNWRNKG